MTPRTKDKLEALGHAFLPALVLALALNLSIVGVTGCLKAAANTPAQALAPGYLNPTDQWMGETLDTAHGIVASLLQQATSGSFVPNATEKATINGLVEALNVADAAYRGYHAGTTTEAQATQAVTLVQAQQTALQAQMSGGK